MLTHQQAEVMINAASWDTADAQLRVHSHKYIAEALRSFLGVAAQDVQYAEQDEGHEPPALDWSDFEPNTIRSAAVFVTDFIRAHGQHIGSAPADLFGSDLYLTAAEHGAGFPDRPEHYSDADALAAACDLFTGFHVAAYWNAGTVALDLSHKRERVAC